MPPAARSRLHEDRERIAAAMESRLIIAYSLLALLVFAVAIGLTMALTVQQRREHRDRRRALAQRERWAERKGFASD